jgi:predicted XRE-type DNA-binding protein
MKKHDYIEGSGNIYADLQVDHPQETRAKADLAHRIIDLIEARKLTQVEAGKLLGVDQPKVSALKRGRLSDFSLERLIGFLLWLDQDVQITVTPKPRSSLKPPTLEVQAASDHSRRWALARLQRLRRALPPDFAFDRDDANAR